MGSRLHLGRKWVASRHLTFELLRNQQRSLRVGKSRRLPKIENKVVPAPARVGFPVDFESMVRRITHNALIGPGGRENIRVLREREYFTDNASRRSLALVRFSHDDPTQFN